MFLNRCQASIGGIAKAPEERPGQSVRVRKILAFGYFWTFTPSHADPYHTYLALASLAIYPADGVEDFFSDEDGSGTGSSMGWKLASMDPVLNATTATAEWVRQHMSSKA